MAKEKNVAKEKKDPAMVALANALKAANEYYAPGVEVARLDAAEAILKYATEEEQWAVDAAQRFLADAIAGKHASLGAGGRIRAARITLAYARIDSMSGTVKA